MVKSEPGSLVKTWKQSGLDIPFIALIEKDDVNLAAELQRAGVFDYQYKDADSLDLLLAKINKAFGLKSTRQKLHQSRKDFKHIDQGSITILDSLSDPAYICNGDHHIQYANPAMKKLFGPEMLHQKCFQTMYNSAKHCKKCQSNQSLYEKDFSYSVRLEVNNDIKYFQISVSSINFFENGTSRLHILRDVTELMHAQEEALENATKYKLLADNSVDIVWKLTERLKFTYVSPSAEHILGYSIDELVGHDLWEFATRKEFKRIARIALEAIHNFKKFKPIHFESTLLHKKGHEIPVEIIGKLLLDKNGKAAGLQGATREISKRWASQKELRRNYTMLRTLIDNIPDLIYVKDRSSRFLLNNLSHLRELNVDSQEEVLMKSDKDYFDEQTSTEFFHDEQKVISTGTPLINKEEFKSYPGGTSKWTLTTKVPIQDDDGQITGIAGINRDITRRKKIELEYLRFQYEFALKNKIAHYFLTARGSNLFKSVLKLLLDEFQSEYGMFGYIDENQNLICKSFTGEVFKKCQVENKDFIFPRDSWGGLWGQSLLELKPVISNGDLHLPEGHIELSNAMSVPIIVLERPIGLICLGNKAGGYDKRDRNQLASINAYIAPILHSYLSEQNMKRAKELAYNDLKVAKDKAEEGVKLKSAFLLNLSHELRTPLNAIMGFSRLIAEQNKDLQENKYLVEQIDSAGGDLIKMVEDTLEMSRIQSGQVELNKMNQKVSTTLNEVAMKFKAHYSEAFPYVDFSIVDKTGNLLLETDHDKLIKAIVQLMDNAVKFTEKGKIEIGAHLNGQSKLVFYVKDNGIGIPEDSQDIIFEKFRKLEDQNMIYRGNGLGLSIAKGLVEAIGGNIQLKSTPGKGTLVNIQIAVAESS